LKFFGQNLYKRTKAPRFQEYELNSSYSWNRGAFLRYDVFWSKIDKIVKYNLVHNFKKNRMLSNFKILADFGQKW